MQRTGPTSVAHSVGRLVAHLCPESDQSTNRAIERPTGPSERTQTDQKHGFRSKHLEKQLSEASSKPFKNSIKNRSVAVSFAQTMIKIKIKTWIWGTPFSSLSPPLLRCFGGSIWGSFRDAFLVVSAAFLLLFVAVLLLSAALCCLLLLSAAFCCCVVAFCCVLLLFCCFLLLFVALCCFSAALLLFCWF